MNENEEKKVEEQEPKQKFAKPNSPQFIYHSIRRKNKKRKEDQQEG